MKYCRFLFALIFLFVVSSQFLSAQFSLSGIVTEGKGETILLEGVEIYIPELCRLDVSKDGGTYIIKGIGAGVYHVQYSKSGYKTIVRTILVKDTATVVHVNLELTGAPSLEVLTGSTLYSEFPYPVVPYSSANYIQHGSLNLTDALSAKPGLDIISEGNAFSKPVIRGMSRNKVQIHQFGTRIENQSWYDRSSSGINDVGISNVIVIKGPASLLYGADASGGVIVLSEEKPPVAGTIEGNVNAAFHSNTLGYVSGAGLKGMSESGIMYGLQVGTQSHTSYVQGAGEELRKNTEDLAFAVNSKFKDQKAKVYVGLSKPWGVSKLTYSYMHHQAGIIGFEDSVYDDPLHFNEQQRERDISYPFIDISSGLISSQNTFIAGNSHINLNLAYQTNSNEEIEVIDEQESMLISMDLNSITYDLKFSTDPLKKFGYTIGSQGIFQSHNNGGSSSLVPDARMSSIGAFALLRYDFRKWNFLAGARFDNRKVEISRYKSASDSIDFRTPEFKREYQPLSGSAGLVFHATKELSIKLNGSTAYSAPNHYQLYAYHFSPDSSRFELGNDSLRIEQNAGLDLGLTWQGKSITLDAGVFYNQLYDHIYLANTGGFRKVNTLTSDTLLPVYYYSQSAGKLSGAEFSLAIHPLTIKWLNINIDYVFQRGTLDAGSGLAFMPSDKAIFSLQIQSAKMNYLNNPYLRIVFSNYFKQDKIAEYETESPAYTLLDLHAGARIKWSHRFLDLSISVNNIFNESYSNHLSLLRYSGYKEMGRDVVIRLSMPFGIMKKK